ncbi:MAG: rhodanese-like domain-containing protein [bacterium]
MKFLYFILTAIFITVPSVWGYTNLTPEQVHNRLVQADTLLLLDVREVSEYQNGHIAEPAGQLPFTPVNMPYNSSVLSSEYSRLPQDIDIIVYCWSGGRSSSASTFLESKGYTRIFNMQGGFSSWTFESRKGGYGDHSGQWIHKTDTQPTMLSPYCCTRSR